MVSSHRGRPALIPSITGLRFVAAFSVLLGHAIHWLANFSTSPNWLILLGSASGLGMPLFFVLSGFVIHYNYHYYFDKVSLTNFLRFMIARFARLYPLYILLLCVYFFQKGIKPWNAPYIFRYLTLTQAWQLVYSSHTWIAHLYLAPAWSISIEWFQYICYALIGVHFFRFKTVYRCVIAFLILTSIYYAADIYFYPRINMLNEWAIKVYAVDVKPQSALMGFVFNTGPLGRFFEFTMGMLVSQIFLLRSSINFSLTENIVLKWLFLISLISVVFIYVNPFNTSFLAFGRNYAALMSPFLAIIVLSSAVHSQSWFSRMLSSKMVVRLGDASYSMYLLHAVFLPGFFIGAFDHPTLYWAFKVMVAISVILIGSLISYSFYEKPAKRFLSRTLNKLLQQLTSLYQYLMTTKKHMPPHIIIRAVSIAFLTTIIFINRPNFANRIDIVEANYGANCKSLIPNKTLKDFQGNATLGAQQLCLHKGSNCSFKIEFEHIGGDPASGCAKDYSITYRCNKDNKSRSVYLAAEAYGKEVKLRC